MTTHTHKLQRWAWILGISLSFLAAWMAYLIWTDQQATSQLATTLVNAQSIRITREGFDDITLLKLNDHWEIQTPCKLAANEQRLTPLIAVLSPGAHQYNADEVDLDTAGLKQPLARVYIDGIEHRLGNTDLDGNRRYLQRGDAVELIPEWVLSLINGGVTAIAQLEIFLLPIEQLTIASSGDKSKSVVSDVNLLNQWQAITAQQIVTWPVPDIELTNTYKLLVEESSGDGIRTINVYENDSLAALVPDNSQCAYLVSPGTLPDSGL